MGERQQPGETPAPLGRPGSRLRAFWPAAGLILVLACVLRFWALDLGLPNRLARPDEDDVLRITALPAQGQFDLGWSVYPSAYVYLCWIWNETGLRAGEALGLLPQADYVSTLVREPSRIFLIARSLSALAGVGAVWLLMLLGRRTLGDLPALAGGLLLATSFLHARDSHAVKPDALLALAVSAAFLAMLPLARHATPRTGALAGLGVGAAMATKYPGVVLLVPVYVAAVMQSEARSWRRLVPAPAIVAALVAGFVFVASSPYLLLNRESIQGMEDTLVLVFPRLFPERSVEAMARFRLSVDPAPVAGYGSLAWGGGFLYHARFSLWYGAGKLATLLAPLGVAWGLSRREPLPVLAACFVLAYFLIVGLGASLLARYMTPLLPPLLLLEAGLLDAASRRWGGKHARAGFALAIGLVVAEPLWNAIAHNRIASRTDTRVLATRWLDERLPAEARVAVYGTRFYPWGAPEIPGRLKRVEAKPEKSALEGNRVRYLVTHDHDLFFSTVNPEVMKRLAPRLTLEADFQPFDPTRARPVFEAADAYYIPFHGFSGVDRPGPHVRVYRFE